MGHQYSVRVVVRSYEIDLMGHVNHAVYHQYGEYARTEHLRAAGFDPFGKSTAGVGIVLLETRVRFLRELTIGQEVEVTSDIEFGSGKTFRMSHLILRDDGTRSAEIECVLGLLDTTARRLLPEPKKRLLKLVDRPELLGGD